MPNLTCLCGENINLSPIPNPQGFKLIQEKILEKFIEELVLIHQQNISNQEFEKQVYDLFYLKHTDIFQIYECPKCGRLAIFIRASDTEPAFWFKREQINLEKADSIASLVRSPLL